MGTMCDSADDGHLDDANQTGSENHAGDVETEWSDASDNSTMVSDWSDVATVASLDDAATIDYFWMPPVEANHLIDEVFTSDIEVSPDTEPEPEPVLPSSPASPHPSDYTDPDADSDVEPQPKRARHTGGYQIFVRTLTGSTIVLDLHDDHSIQELKQMILDRLGYWMTTNDVIYLCHNGRRLDEDETMFDYWLSDGDTVTMHSVLRGGMQASAASAAFEELYGEAFTRSTAAPVTPQLRPPMNTAVMQAAFGIAASQWVSDDEGPGFYRPLKEHGCSEVSELSLPSVSPGSSSDGPASDLPDEVADKLFALNMQDLENSGASASGAASSSAVSGSGVPGFGSAQPLALRGVKRAAEHHDLQG